jgi:hypothetical protein
MVNYRRRGLRIWTPGNLTTEASNTTLPVPGIVVVRHANPSVKVGLEDAIMPDGNCRCTDHRETAGTTSPDDSAGTVTLTATIETGAVPVPSSVIDESGSPSCGPEADTLWNARDGGTQFEGRETPCEESGEQQPEEPDDEPHEQPEDGQPHRGAVEIERVLADAAKLTADSLAAGQPGSDSDSRSVHDAPPVSAALSDQHDENGFGPEVLSEVAFEENPESLSIDARSNLVLDKASSVPLLDQSSSLALPATETAAIEAQLSAHVGPIARLLVARYSALHTSMDGLVEQLVDHIPSRAGREKFRAALGTALAATRVGAGQHERLSVKPLRQAEQDTTTREDSLGEAPLPEQIDAAALKLARYLGPIARVIAKREASVAADLRTFHDRLALSIANEVDRAAFLRTMI